MLSLPFFAALLRTFALAAAAFLARAARSSGVMVSRLRLPPILPLSRHLCARGPKKTSTRPGGVFPVSYQQLEPPFGRMQGGFEKGIDMPQPRPRRSPSQEYNPDMALRFRRRIRIAPGVHLKPRLARSRTQRRGSAAFM